MDRLGGSAIVALINSGDLSLLQSTGVKTSDFFDEARSGVEFVKNYTSEHGSMPSVKVVEEKIGHKLPGAAEVGTASYELNRVRERRLGLKLQKIGESLAHALEDREPEKGLSILKSFVNSEENVPDSLISSTESLEDRLEIYDSVRSIGGLIGVPSPWKALDARIQGWANGTMNVVVAPTNAGKSWLSILIAHHAMTLGFDVLLVTLEMSSFRLLRRMDAVVTKTPFGKLRDASFDEEEFEEFSKRLRANVPKGELFVADKSLVRTVADVTALIYQKKPKLVVVDGAYRFETGASDKNKWAGIVNLCNDIQDTAEITDTPWVITTQQGDATEKSATATGTKPNPWKVRYGKEFLINADTFINMHQTPEMRMLKVMELHVGKMRDFGGKVNADEPVRITWDMEAMDFTQLTDDDDDATTPMTSSAVVAY
jgi:hypothetical protein